MKKSLKKKTSPNKLFPYFNFLAILVLIVFAIIFFSVLSYQSNHPSQMKFDIVPTPSPTTIQKNAEVTPPPYHKPIKYPSQKAGIENGYAIIPELHIKFKIDSNLSDLTYTIFSYDTPGDENYTNKMQYAMFTTQSLFNIGGSYCISDNDAIGSIGKSLENPVGKGSGPLEENVKKIDNYYYSFLSPQATCTDNKQAQVLETSQIKALEKAFQTLEVF